MYPVQDCANGKLVKIFKYNDCPSAGKNKVFVFQVISVLNQSNDEFWAVVAGQTCLFPTRSAHEIHCLKQTLHKQVASTHLGMLSDTCHVRFRTRCSLVYLPDTQKTFSICNTTL